MAELKNIKGICPVCASKDILYWNYDITFLDQVIYFCECTSCKAEFKEHYNLVYTFSQLKD